MAPARARIQAADSVAHRLDARRRLAELSRQMGDVARGIKSRSQVIEDALYVLRERELELAYKEASAEADTILPAADKPSKAMPGSTSPATNAKPSTRR